MTKKRNKIIIFLYFIRMQNNEGDHYKDSDIFMHICVIQ